MSLRDTRPEPAADWDGPVLRVEQLKKHYSVSQGLLASIFGEKNRIKAVNGVDLEIEKGETLGLVGESGSGKSTLGETILRLEEPTDGTISFRGTDISMLSSRQLRPFRQDIQIIFQDPYESLNPKKTVYQTVSEPLRNFWSIPRTEFEEAVSGMLHDLGLRPASQFLELTPGQLSGGQRQRVNIARALILEPDLLIADEPLTMLDPSIKAGIIKKLEKLQSELDFAMLYISHDIPVVKLVSDRALVMYRGQIVERAATDEIIANPMHPYTRALIDSLPRFTKERERVRLPEDPTEDHESPSGCHFHPRCPDAMEECSNFEPALADVDAREVACFLHHDVEVPEDATE